MNLDGIFGQSLGTPPARDFAAHNRAHDPVDIPDRQDGHHLFFALDGGRTERQQHCIIQRLLQTVILRDLAEPAHFCGHFRLMQNFAEIQSLGFPMVNGLPNLQALHAANQFVHLPNAKLRH